MQAPYRPDLCRPKSQGATTGRDRDPHCLTVDVLAEALDKSPDVRDAVVLALQQQHQLAAAAQTQKSQDKKKEE